MFYHAKNKKVLLDDTDMDYVTFGKGRDALVMIPGLGDGLKTVKGMAIPMAVTYQIFAKQYKVYVFSRKNRLKEGCTTREMAGDLARAMKILGISKANVFGISQGGMIAQYLAIDYPDLVEKLVLAVTSSKINPTIRQVVEKWIILGEKKDYRNLFIDTAEKFYSEKTLKKYRFLYPFLTRMGKPKDFGRFLIQAKSCLSHNAYLELNKIVCPTLVLGGECDRIVGGDASKELAEKIPGSELFLYPNLGHGAYEEAEDFNDRVVNFLHDSY